MKEVYLEFYNHSFVLQGLISQFSSLTWVQRFQDVGTFELLCPYTEDIKSWLAVDLFVMRSDAEQVYYVESVEYSRDINGNKTVKITGADVVKILNRRIIYTQITSTAGNPVTIGATIQGMLNATVNNAFGDNARRVLNNYFSFDYSSLPSTPTLHYDLFGVNLLEQLWEYSKIYRFGITAIRTPSATEPMKITFKSFTDKSDVVIFSEGMKNLSAWSYTHDNSDRINTVYVKKHDFDTAVVNENTFSGLDRFELFTDSGISDQNADGTTIPDLAYTRLLQTYGSTLVKGKGTKEVVAESQETVFKYPTDYTLGDLVYLITDVTGGRVAVTEITEIFDGTGYSIFPTFDTEF